MNVHNKNLKANALSVAVHGALVAMCSLPLLAYSADPADGDVAFLRKPTNTIEFGAEYLSRGSAKFGEYNGLNNSGTEFISNFSVQGGDAYEGGDGTRRWGVTGSDLGTTSRELGASISNQGRWNLNINYDELRHNISDSYQTPQQGQMGGNTFTMPANFGSINSETGSGTATPTRPTQQSARVLNATQLGAFHTEEVSTTRKNTSFGAGFNFSRQWSVRFDYNHLDQSGAKLIGTGAQGGVNLTGGSSGRAEANNVLMNPTDYKTDTFNLALNWRGDAGHLTAGYYGSFFRDANNTLNWQNALASGNPSSACTGVYCFVNESMSTAPGNNFHQFNLSGGYVFSSSTKLVGGVSYGRNTQNDAYAPTSIAQASGTAYSNMQTNGLPRTSLDGLVVTQHADLKLTNQTTKDLLLSAVYKYNERDNRTSSNPYLFKDLGNANYTAIDTPYSNKKQQVEVAGDYRLTKGQNLRLAYEREKIDRWCDGVVSGKQCVASPSSDEDKLGLTYRARANDSVQVNFGYAYAKRNADFDHTFLANTASAPAVNAGDRLGFIAYPYASRKQDIYKAGVNWQPTEQLDLGLNGRYSKDAYEATLGVQQGKTSSVNLDATFSFTEKSSASFYASWLNSDRDLRSGNNGNATTTAPTNIWTNALKQDDLSIGINTKHTGLLAGKLDLIGDLSYSTGKAGYSTLVPYNLSCGTATVLTCGSLPDIKSDLTTLKLAGIYSVDRNAKVGVSYTYQRLTSNDYYYNSYQYGYTPNRVMPTNEQAPNYSVNVVTASYIYSFK
jgi:MtrB/PioB family decaheme-associated outer membrane protein